MLVVKPIFHKKNGSCWEPNVNEIDINNMKLTCPTQTCPTQTIPPARVGGHDRLGFTLGLRGFALGQQGFLDTNLVSAQRNTCV